MLFANEGFVQLSGEPEAVILDFSRAIRLLRKKTATEISEEDADYIVVAIGKLAMLTDEEENEFLASLQGQIDNLKTLTEKLDEYARRK